MRLLLATLIVTMAAAAPAVASSFVMLKRAEIQPSPSIIVFEEPAAKAASVQPGTELAPLAYPQAAPAIASAPAAERIERVSASVVAMGQPAVEATIVAAIPSEEKRPRNPHLPPMVIRGGIFGDLFVRGSGLAGAITTEPAQTASQAPAGTPAQSPAPGEQRQPEAPRAPPPPQPQAPAAPTRAPE